MVFPAFQGQMACLECRASRGRKDPREGKVQKDRSVISDRRERRVQEETEDAKGLLGRADPLRIKGIKGETGLGGIKGERGIAGNQGEKGDKGEKGESVKASQASVVPQINWKQCVWKSNSESDNGKIKVRKKYAK